MPSPSPNGRGASGELRDQLRPTPPNNDWESSRAASGQRRSRPPSPGSLESFESGSTPDLTGRGYHSRSGIAAVAPRSKATQHRSPQPPQLSATDRRPTEEL